MTRATVCVCGRFPSTAVNHPLDCSAINDEASGGLLGVVTDVASDEAHAFLVDCEFAIRAILGK